MKISKKHISAASNVHNHRIVAADEDFESDEFDIVEQPEDGFNDTLDSMADTIEDIQDQVDDIEEDDIDIELENNINNHYIAECDRCHGIFISAVVESDQEVDHITGVCPLCEQESDQFLNWVVKAVER